MHKDLAEKEQKTKMQMAMNQAREKAVEVTKEKLAAEAKQKVAEEKAAEEAKC